MAMTRLLQISIGLFLLTAITYGQATLTGKWDGETGNGRKIGLDLKSDGKQLTGTFSRDSESSAITEGAIVKQTFSFKAAIAGQLTVFNGTVAGDDISLIPEGAKNAVLLKRVK
jgi:hypothetical protein